MNKKITRKIITVILIISIALISTSCNPDKPKQYNQFVGTQGLTAEFSKNLPPDKVYENQEIPTVVRLQNKGAFNLNGTELYGTIIINHNDPFLEPGADQPFKRTYRIEGKSLDYIEGEKKIVEGYTYKTKELLGVKQTHGSNIYTTICYPYQTVLTQMVCIENDIYEQDTNSICRNQEKYSYGEGQGAPISIIEIESEMIPQTITSQGTNNMNVITDLLNGGRIESKELEGGTLGVRPQFRIKINNEQKGTPFVNNKGGNSRFDYIGGRYCESTEDFQQNTVKIEAKLGNYELKCQPDVVNIETVEQTLCSLDKNDVTFMNENLQIPLSINLYYNYKQTTRKEIQIERQPGR